MENDNCTIIIKDGEAELCGSAVDILSSLLTAISHLYAAAPDEYTKKVIRAVTIAAVSDSDSPLWDDTPCDGGVSISINIPRKEGEE